MGLASAHHSGTLNYKVGARFMELGEGAFEMIRHLAEIKTVNVRCLLENFVKEDHLERQEEVGKRDYRSVSVKFMAVFDCIKKRKA
jgi:hypothetical protein